MADSTSDPVAAACAESLDPAVVAEAEQRAKEDDTSPVACALYYYRLVTNGGVGLPRMYPAALHVDWTEIENDRIMSLLTEQAGRDGLTVRHGYDNSSHPMVFAHVELCHPDGARYDQHPVSVRAVEADYGETLSAARRRARAHVLELIRDEVATS